ncbi:16863_t:CDS:1, partial [Gigaspora margarita]
NRYHLWQSFEERRISRTQVIAKCGTALLHVTNQNCAIEIGHMKWCCFAFHDYMNMANSSSFEITPE